MFNNSPFQSITEALAHGDIPMYSAGFIQWLTSYSPSAYSPMIEAVGNFLYSVDGNDTTSTIREIDKRTGDVVRTIPSGLSTYPWYFTASNDYLVTARGTEIAVCDYDGTVVYHTSFPGYVIRRPCFIGNRLVYTINNSGTTTVTIVNLPGFDTYHICPELSGTAGDVEYVSAYGDTIIFRSHTQGGNVFSSYHVPTTTFYTGYTMSTSVGTYLQTADSIYVIDNGIGTSSTIHKISYNQAGIGSEVWVSENILESFNATNGNSIFIREQGNYIHVCGTLINAEYTVRKPFIATLNKLTGEITPTFTNNATTQTGWSLAIDLNALYLTGLYSSGVAYVTNVKL